MDDKKKLLLMRLGIFAVLLIAPAIYLIFRYDIFQKVSKLNMGGTGILVILLLAVSAFVFIKQLVKDKGYSLWKQIVKAVLYIIIPCFTIFLIIYFSQEHLDRLREFIIIAMICWFSAYIVNPLPEYFAKKDKQSIKDVINETLNEREEN